MPDEFHHLDKIGVFFVSAVKFCSAPSGNNQEGRSIRTYMIQGREFVDDRPRSGNAPGSPFGKVCNHLSAVGDYRGHAVGICPVLGKIVLVEPEHGHKIASGRVSCKVDFGGRSTIPGDILHHPGDGCGGIVDDIGDLRFRVEAISGRHHHIILLQEGLRSMLGALRQATAVEPDYYRTVFCIPHIAHIQLAPGDSFFIGYVFVCLILSSCHRGKAA